MLSLRMEVRDGCWLCWLVRGKLRGSRSSCSRSRLRSACQRNNEYSVSRRSIIPTADSCKQFAHREENRKKLLTDGDACSRKQEGAEFGVEAITVLNIGKMRGVEFHVACSCDVACEILTVGGSSRDVVCSGNHES